MSGRAPDIVGDLSRREAYETDAELGRELAVPVVSSDRTRKAAAGVPSTVRADPNSYAAEARDRTYEENHRVVETSGGPGSATSAALAGLSEAGIAPARDRRAC
jgi:hypothetical protein